MKVIALNGPPGCGKDEGAAALVYGLGVLVNCKPWSMKFAGPLKRGVGGFLGLSQSDIEARKSESVTIGDVSLSLRDVLISFSEDWVKQTFGPRAFGHLAMYRMQEYALRDSAAYGEARQYLGDDAGEQPDPTFIFSDSGFVLELEPVVDFVGAENVLVVCIARPGHDFENDSRSYLNMDHLPGVKAITIVNNGTLDEYRSCLLEAVTEWINEGRVDP